MIKVSWQGLLMVGFLLVVLGLGVAGTGHSDGWPLFVVAALVLLYALYEKRRESKQ